MQKAVRIIALVGSLFGVILWLSSFQDGKPTVIPQPLRRFDRVLILEDSGETSAAVSLGDLDGDGDLDIVLSTGRHWASPLRVYFNDGKGKFPVTQKIGERDYKSYGVPLADLDGDGHLDLVVGTDFGDTKPYFLNNGKGRFTLAGHYGEKDMATRNLVLADMNGDGHIDIVVVNRGGKVGRPSFIFLGDGKGHFPVRKPIGTGKDSLVSVAVGDLNGDGKPDLVLASRDERQCFALLNNGKAEFGDPLPFGPENAETRAIALGDLNGDGKLDVVASHLNGGSFIYWGDGKGRFPDKVAFRPESESSYSLAIADLNGDGHLDIVAGNLDQADAVYFNDGRGKSFRVVRFGGAERGSLNAGANTSFATYGLAIGDIDGDGYPDIVVARTGGPSAIYFSDKET